MNHTVTGTDIGLAELHCLLSYVQEAIDEVDDELAKCSGTRAEDYWYGNVNALLCVDRQIRDRIATLKHQE